MTFILPRHFPAALINFAGRGGGVSLPGGDRPAEWRGGPVESSCPGGSEYVWQGGERVNFAWLWAAFVSPFPIAGDWFKVAHNQAFFTLPYTF